MGKVKITVTASEDVVVQGILGPSLTSRLKKRAAPNLVGGESQGLSECLREIVESACPAEAKKKNHAKVSATFEKLDAAKIPDRNDVHRTPDSNLTDRIQHCLFVLGMSLEDTARRCGTSPSKVRRTRDEYLAAPHVPYFIGHNKSEKADRKSQPVEEEVVDA
jgi:hypothetical protein